MSDVFGPRGKNNASTSTPTPAGKSTTQSQSSGQNCHIEYDNETGEMRLTLPTHLAKYKDRGLWALLYPIAWKGNTEMWFNW